MAPNNPSGDKRPPSFDGAGEFPLPFGNYILLQAFARGGMGEVYLGKRTGAILGAEKYCVLKKLRPELTRDREYVARFIDEARIVVQLSHANICQVFDVGRVGEEYYLAMEYVSGRDARSLQDKAREQGRSLEEASVLQLITETLAALDYAHRRTHSLTGESLNLVHRDVSPQNVMVSFEGEVKLIDFGLASSRLKVERTQPNIVMGKMAYMAPEQARGDGIDRRADLFAAGVILYELLAGERFYEGMSSNDIWMVVGRGGYVPKKWDTLSPGVAAILGRALHPDVNQRYADCGEFREALVSYLHTNHPGKGERALRELVQVVFANEIAAERERLAGFGEVSGELSRDELEMTRSQSVSLAHADYISDADAPSGSARVVHDERTTLKPDIDDLPTQAATDVPRSLRTDLITAEGDTGSGDGGISEEQTLLEQPIASPRRAPLPEADVSDPTQRTNTPPTGQTLPALGPHEATEAVVRSGRGGAAATTVIVPDAPITPERRSALLLVVGFALLVGVGLGAAWLGRDLLFGAQPETDATAIEPATPVSDPEPKAPDDPEVAPTGDPPPEPVIDGAADAGAADAGDVELGDDDEPEDEAVAAASRSDARDSAESRRAARERRLRVRAANAAKYQRQAHAALDERGYTTPDSWPRSIKRHVAAVDDARTARQKEAAALRLLKAARKAPSAHAKAAPKHDPPKHDPPKHDPPKHDAPPKPHGESWMSKVVREVVLSCGSPPPDGCGGFDLKKAWSAGDDATKVKLERRALRCAKRCK